MNRRERRLKRKEDTKYAALVIAALVLTVVALVMGTAFTLHKVMQKKNKLAETSGKENTEHVVDTQQEEEVQQPIVDPLVTQAAQMIAQMSLEDKIAQMFIITPKALTGYANVTAAGDTTRAAYADRPVGGLIYMAENLLSGEQTTQMLQNMQKIAVERTGVPVFLSVDEEGGTVARIAGNETYGVSDVGAMSEIGASGDSQRAYQAGVTIGKYLNQLGFQVDYAPVADVLTNPDNTAIGTRAFSSDASVVSEMIVRELEGLQSEGIFGVVKHFPGQGGTAGDSHESVVTLDKSAEELMQTELVPFQKAIESGVSFVMVGHIAVPQVVGDDTPSSLSQMMVTKVLREQLGYQGIVITDAMNMGAITNNYNANEAAVLAVNAGVDMILMPQDYQTAYNGLLAAVKDGTITEKRINESLLRIIKVKLQMQNE